MKTLAIVTFVFLSLVGLVAILLRKCGTIEQADFPDDDPFMPSRHGWADEDEEEDWMRDW